MSADGVRQDPLKASRREARLDALLVASMFHIAMVVLCFIDAPGLVQVATTILLAFAVALGGVTVLHHGAHNRFGSRRASNALWVHVASPTGFWVEFWAAKHRVHHMSPARYPDDLFTGASGLFRLHPRAPHRSVHRFQAWYILPAYCGYWLVDQLSQWRYLAMSKDPRYSHIVVPNKWWSFLREKTVCAVLVAPYVAQLDRRTTVELLTAAVAGSFAAALLVSINHVATGAVLGGADEFDWSEYVRYSTINYSPRSRMVSFLSGGLNLHSAHHLRPIQTRQQLTATHKNLQSDNARAALVTYSFVGAVRSHFAALRWLGAGGTADVLGDPPPYGVAPARRPSADVANA